MNDLEAIRLTVLAYQFGCDSGAPDLRIPWTSQVRPTGLGAELFLWGHAAPETSANVLLKQSALLPLLTEIPATPGVTLLNAPKPPAATDTER